MAPPVIPKVGKDNKAPDRKKAADLKLIREEKVRIEKEKAEYQKLRDAELKKILELKSQVEAGASNVKAEYEKLEKEQHEKRDQTGAFDEKLKENDDKMDALGDAEYLKEEPNDSEHEFKFTDKDFKNDEDGEIEPLFNLDTLRRALGQEEIGEVITWRPGGGNKRVVISRYGPKNASQYRLQNAADADGSWQESKLPMYTQQSLRFGDMKDDYNKFIHGGSEAKGIKAVAWYFDDNDEEPELLLLPKTRPKPTNGVRRPALYVEGVAKVQWEINGEEKFSWETRGTLVRLFGSTTTADNLIYLTAQSQGTRYREWKRKERRSEDRSPTPMPGLLRPHATPGPEKEKPKVETSGSTTTEEAIENAARKKWATKKKLDPENLSDAEDARFDVYWEAFQEAAAAA